MSLVFSGLDAYEYLAGNAIIEEIRTLGERMKGYRVLHVNSTSVGGGVAEILSSLVPLMREAGLESDWKVMKAEQAFFEVTKQLHNGIHGQPANITADMMEVYLYTAMKNRPIIEEDKSDLVVIHDQQPLGLAAGRKNGRRWLWYCHVDPRYAVPEVWFFLAPMVSACDLAVLHLPEYARDLPILQYFMPPAIDPLSEKNREVSPAEMEAVLQKLDIDPEGPPLIVQVSRFDRLKDPAGVIQVFRQVREKRPCRLILAGGSADDDPEGRIVLDEVLSMADGDPDIRILALAPDANLEINVLQRRADVVIQKSLREGFGLTATEALWKARPVVATTTGGLAHQVLDEKTGLCAQTVSETAAKVDRLLDDPVLARRIGADGREHVRRNYILPVYMRNWLKLLTLLSERSH